MTKYGKFLCVLVSCCVILFGCAAPHVHAVAGIDDLVIGGAAIMTVGLVGVLGMLSINAAGFSDALYQAASEANQDIRAFASSLFASYARTQNITAGQAVNLAAQGTSYLEDGTIIFNKAMSDMMSGFVNWAWDEDGGDLVSFAPSVNDTGYVNYADIVSSLNNPTFNYSVYPYSQVISYSDSNGITTSLSGAKYFVLQRYSTSNSGSYPVFYGFNDQPFNVVQSFSNGNSRTYNSNAITYKNITYYYVGITYIPYADANNSFILSNFQTSVSSLWDVAFILFNGVIDSEPVYDVNLDVLDQIADNSSDVNLLNPNDFITVSDAPVGGGTINIEDWLNALADVSVGQIASIPVEAEGVITDAVGELAGTDDIAVSQDAVQAGSQAVADSTSVSVLDEFTLDLTDFFPFCIPFDIYDMLSMFSASREAPHFDYRFYIPGICDETIIIDLSPFDSVALVLRRVELVAFAIGLAFVTKKLIQGGD